MPPADNRAALAAATQHRAETTRERARDALRRFDHDGTPISFTAVATAAGVSRSLLYQAVAQTAWRDLRVGCGGRSRATVTWPTGRRGCW